MTFRTSIMEVSPPFLVEEGGTAEACQYAEGVAMDGIADWAIDGVLASMPGFGTPTANFLIGRDMQIDRGPTEDDSHYETRLQRAIDSHRVRGNGPELCRQLLAWFSPSTATPIRLVSNSAVWHEIDPVTEVVTKTVVGNNWTWDALTPTNWWRGWVIIDSTLGPWNQDDKWGDPGLWGGAWGGSGSWGSSADPAEVESIRRIVDKWKPAHIFAVNIIVTFDPSIFEATDVSGPGENPDGDADSSEWRLDYAAAFWRGKE